MVFSLTKVLRAALDNNPSSKQWTLKIFQKLNHFKKNQKNKNVEQYQGQLNRSVSKLSLPMTIRRDPKKQESWGLDRKRETVIK